MYKHIDMYFYMCVCVCICKIVFTAFLKNKSKLLMMTILENVASV